ncbi:MAG: hypothetical protein L0I93_05000, partial [Atopostipes suicloacalis]|nr:hypothetical protein [Atopostipes suicloacalis]
MKKLSLLKGIFILLALSLFTACGGNKDTIRIGNQVWTEASIIANITEKIIKENTDYDVERKELESNVIQWNALTNDDIDIWPTYTSSLLNVFEEEIPDLENPDEIYDYVSTMAREEYDLVMLERMGFYNNYDLAVDPDVAEEYNLETYSDLAEVSDQLAIAADTNFKDRPDVYPLLQEVYGMDFKEVYLMSVAIKFTAVEDGQADLVSCYTTDAGISRLGLVVLEDDQNAILRFDAAYLLQADLLEKYPDLEDLLNKVKITNEEMAQ